MAALPQKLENGGSSSKFNPPKEANTRATSHRNLFRDDRDRPFTAQWQGARRNTMKSLRFYRELLVNRKLLDKLSQEHGNSSESGRNWGLKVHMRAAKVVESSDKYWVNTGKQIGPISGINVGDEFYWRGELIIVGLHRDFQRGIDYMKLVNGKTLATSIVDSGRYENVEGVSSDMMVYCGEGENPNFSCGRKPKDQKLARGNLALKNSMDEKMPVRVIRRAYNDGVEYGCDYKFVYGGLYLVTEYWKEKGKFGTDVYKFLLRKCE
ncbi:hypothetical protein V6N13_102953 [Hibiscus sabdariffa]|uniref:YDG domain-containing protein n=1 Tax=Hibiscus sabdariffa TaxID=183260 RepID=A0ABR2D5L1_9ROSI